MKTYIFVFFGATLLSLGLTPLVIWVGQCLSIYGDSHVRRVHTESIPRIGGIAIFLAMMGLTIPVLLIDNRIGVAFRAIRPEVIGLLATGTFIFLVGLADDMASIRARTKLLAQLLAAIVLCAVGVRIESIAFGDWFTLRFGMLGYPITIFWIVGVTNAVNLIDGLDGLAAGIAAIACGVIAILALIGGEVVTAVLMLALLGSLTGFLTFNFNPARIFMGDCGSLFLGFMLAASSVMNAHKSATLVALALPFLALGVPIFDTLFCMLRRLLERRGMFSPDRGHIHHRLLDMGLHHHQVVLFIYLVTFLTAAFGMFMMVTRNVSTVVVLGCLTVSLLLVFRLVGAVRLRETLTGVKQKMDRARQQQQLQREFDDAAVTMQHAAGFGAWWQALCAGARGMGLTWISLTLENRDGSDRTLVWRNEQQAPDLEDVITMQIPVRQRRSGRDLRLEAAAVDESRETATRRMQLLARLTGEYSLAEVKSDAGLRPAGPDRWARPEPLPSDINMGP